MKKAYDGHYLGTLRTPVLVMNDSGDAFSWPVYRAIDYSAENGALFQSLVNNTLNTALCPDTGASFDLSVPVAIHDAAEKRFALFVPPTLRHQSFEFRQQLFEALQSSDVVPKYVSDFTIIFNPTHFENVSTGGEDLAAEKAQLAEVRERIDKEREQLNVSKEKNDAERLELESALLKLASEKQALELEKLTLEQKQLDHSQGYETSAVVESTQIVTDDQFLEIMDDEDSIVMLAEASDFLEIEEDFDITPSRSGFPISSKRFLKSSNQSVQIIDNEIVAIAELSPPEIKALSEDTSFFIQLHDVKGTPIISMMLANLGTDGEVLNQVSWPLDIKDTNHQAIIEKIRLNPRLRVGIYDPTGSLSNGFKIQAPLASNLEWMLSEIKKKGIGIVPFKDAEKAFLADDFEKLGGMKHGFSFDSFESLKTPTETKLAAGIVGYWSTDDMFSYLIGNRSFPLHQFRRIQDRIIRSAAEFGIFLNDALRSRALDIGIADSQRSLIQLMFANFAEVSVALRLNDLTPTDQWENWDALLTVGEALGIPPDSDVVELAENALKRAQDFQDILKTEKSNSSHLIRDIFEDFRIETDDDATAELIQSLCTNVEKVLPLLTRAVKTDGPLEKYVHLLASLEKAESGTISVLLKDRSKRLRDVAKQAQKHPSSKN